MVQEEKLAPLKVKFTYLPNSKRFKELYNILSKKDGLNLSVKTGLIYPMIDADKIIKELHQFVNAPEFKPTDKERLIISFVLVSNEKNLAFEVSRYSLKNNKQTVKDIVYEQLDTTYVDPEEFDSGKSDFQEEAKILKQRIEESYEIQSNQLSENVSVTNKKPSMFNKLFNKKKTEQKELSAINSEESNKKLENEKINEKNIKEHKPVIENKVVEKEEKPTKELKQSDKEVNIETEKSVTENKNKVNPNSNKVEDTINENHMIEDKKKKIKDEPAKKVTSTRKEQPKNVQKVIIPKLSYESPEISLLTGDYVSKAVQEYLNEAEYARVLKKNKKIEDYNNELNAYYLDLQKELEEKLEKYAKDKKPTEQDIKEFKEREIARVQSSLTSFENDIKSNNAEILSMKREQFGNDLKVLKEKNQERIEHLKREIELEEKSFENKENTILESLEKEHEKQLSEQLSRYKEELKAISREKLKLNHQEKLDKYYMNRDSYRSALTQNMIESLKKKYDLYQTELSALTHDSYLSQIKDDIQKIKSNAEAHQEKIEKERTRQAIENTHFKELELKDIDVRKLREEKEHNISERKRIEAENRERELKIKEKQQEDDHLARMKELELKYMKPKKEDTEEPKFNRFLIGVLSTVLGLLLLILVGAYLMLNPENDESYQSLLDNQDYSGISQKYPDKLDQLSETLYQENNNYGLETLVNESNNEFALFRYHLLNNNKKEIIETYEKMSEKDSIKNNELLQVAHAYMDNTQFEKAQELNENLNDRELNKQLAEIEYYLQVKAELENVINSSKDKDNIKKAEQELKQVKIILGEK